jgi:DNA-binding NtrC family response regulator
MSTARALSHVAGRSAEAGGRGSYCASVLVVEDDPGYSRLLAEALASAAACLRVRLAATAAEAVGWLTHEPVDVVLLDRTLPDGDGLAVARAMRIAGRQTAIVVLTANSSVASAVEAMRAGAIDYVVKDSAALERAVEVVVRLAAEAGAAAERAARGGTGAAALIGVGAAIDALRCAIRRCAHSMAAVLIEGETGVGKELVARALHQEGPRAGGPFVAINCGALPEHLVESELFGHVRGAFTGAHRDHPGLLVEAARGTLFLDEVEDLPLGLQVKLLRLLQESEYRPVGSTQTRQADVRIVAASNADLARMVEEHRFRRDLYYRLNVLSISVPPLRTRLDDIPVLIRHFIALHGSQRRGFPEPTAAQLDELGHHPWPGNVRELANLVERALVLGSAGDPAAGWDAALRQLRLPKGEWLVPSMPPAVSPRAPAPIRDENPSRALLIRVLERNRWRREAAARELGVSRVTLWRRMRRLGLKLDGSPET